MKLNTTTYSNINFGTRAQTIQQSNTLMSELIEKSKASQLTFKEIKPILSRYFPQVEIKQIGIFDKIGYLADGCFLSRIKPNGKYEISDSILKLKIPFFRSFCNSAKFLSTVVHEATHAFQTFDNEMSLQSTYQKYKPSEKDLLTLRKIGNSVEGHIIIPSYLNILDLPGEQSKTSLIELWKCGNTFSEKLKKICKNTTSTLNPNLLKEYLHKCALMEEDAYIQGWKTSRKLGMRTDLAIYGSKIYRLLAKAVQTL